MYNLHTYLSLSLSPLLLAYPPTSHYVCTFITYLCCSSLSLLPLPHSSALSLTPPLLPQPPAPPITAKWAITPEMKAKYDAYFSGIDKDKDGFVTGDESRGLFMASSLPQNVLANIWWVICQYCCLCVSVSVTVCKGVTLCVSVSVTVCKGVTLCVSVSVTVCKGVTFCVSVSVTV